MTPADIRDPSPRRTGYSMTPEAVYARAHRLLDDAAAERAKEASRRYRGRIMAKRAVDRANLKAHRTYTTPWSPSPRLMERIRRHLARGRDIGDIAVREGIVVSLIARAVAQMGGCNPTEPIHSQAATR